MIVSHNREKLVNAIIFFAANTKYCGKIKLIKLLYLLDFSHFRTTGLSVTGLEYHAWRLGPVPIDVYQEWDEPAADLASAIQIVPERVIDYVRELVVPKRHFDAARFTKRELSLMEELARRFREEKSRPLINFTHAELGPWNKIWDSGKGQNDRIPYTLAIADDDPNRAAVREAARSREALITASSLQ
jgi:uncharacterized phage-associated protein